MAYFDDPAHSEKRAQWERELAALREERQRRMNSGAVSGRKSQRENTVKLPTFEELVQQAALRHQNKEYGRQPEAPRHEQMEPTKPEEAPRREQKKRIAPERGNVRVRMTFAELITEEEMQRPQIVSGISHQKQRTMEAGNAL